MTFCTIGTTLYGWNHGTTLAGVCHSIVKEDNHGSDGPNKIALSLRICVRLAASAWDNGFVSRVRELEQRLERTEQQLRLLQKISRYLVRQTKLQDALDGVVTMVVEFMDCDSCLLYLLDNRELVLRASNRPSAVGSVKLAMNEGLTGWVAREKRLLAISREAFRDPRFKFFSDLPEDTYEAFLSAPVLSRRGVEGVINVQHRDPHSHTGIEMELLTSVGEQLGCLLMLSQAEMASHENAHLVTR
jgi:signal transduction protein with GAF and PtsI domain